MKYYVHIEYIAYDHNDDVETLNRAVVEVKARNAEEAIQLASDNLTEEMIDSDIPIGIKNATIIEAPNKTLR